MKLQSLSEFTRFALISAAVLSCAHSVMVSAIWIAHGVAGYDFGVRIEETPLLTDVLFSPLLFLLPVWPLLLAPALFRSTRMKPENRKTALCMLIGAACALALPMSVLSVVGLDEFFSSAPDAGQGIGVALGVVTAGPSLLVSTFGAGMGFIAARLH